MSAMSRRKGAAYELEVIADIARVCGVQCKRNLDQARDGGGDIPFGRFLIECKRRARIPLYKWIDQCVKSRAGGQIPVLAIRADSRESLVIMRLTDFLELAAPKPTEAQQVRQFSWASRNAAATFAPK